MTLQTLLAKFNFIGYLWFKCLNYRIIPLGCYCLPRLIMTSAGFKPGKKYGELSLPFDTAFHNSVEIIVDILNNDFKTYFDDLEYSEEDKYWVNKSINAIYNHDGCLTKAAFIDRYSHRIKNFYKYIKSKKHCFFVIASFNINVSDIEKLYSAILRHRKKEFSLIVINHGENIVYNKENICIINEPFTLSNDWVNEFETEEGKIFYNNIITEYNKFKKLTCARR